MQIKSKYINDCENKISNTLYVIKFFAILFVISAHMTFITSDIKQTEVVADSIRNTLGQIGVPIFFIVSGYFYRRSSGDTKIFWTKKAEKLIIPWFLFGILTFILSIILSSKHDNIVLNCAKWTLGFKTWFWYMTVLMILFILFKFIKQDIWLYISMAVSAISVLLTIFNIIPREPLNQYLNVLNWIGFFAFGILINKHKLINKIISVPIGIISFLTLILFSALTVNFCDNDSTYINYFSLIVEFSGFCFFLNISYVLSEIKLFKYIGQRSFFIYLSHMQIAGFINTRLPYNCLFFVLRPLIVLAFMSIIAKITEFVFEKLNLSKLSFLIGLK